MDNDHAFTVAYVVVGALLMVMSLSQSFIARLPLSAAMLYVLVGMAIGPWGLDLLRLDAMEDSVLLEKLTEVAVIVSLFIAGMKLDLPLSDARWRVPWLLASTSMVFTVAAITAVGVCVLDLPLGVSVLLGAVLAPTDPVLASDVQLSDAGDRDRLRFGLTGEGGLNDGTAFPFVMLGLGLTGLHELGAWAWRWWFVDVLWAISAGLLIGWLVGTAVGRAVLFLRRRHKEDWGSDEFIALGLIALAYGVALLCNAYGFLAVFAAGLALGRTDRQDRIQHPLPDPSAVEQAQGVETEQGKADTSHALAPSMMGAVKRFNLQLERVAEVAVVLSVGVLLASVQWMDAALWFIPLLFGVIRPAAVGFGLLFARRASLDRQQRVMMSWFGIRGIGSIYYLMYAISHGLSAQEAGPLVSMTVSVVLASVVLHGVSVTPLMHRYEQRNQKKRVRPQ